MATLTDVAANTALDGMGALWVKYHIGDPLNTGLGSPSVGLTARTAAGLGAAAARARSNTAEILTAAGSTAAETISHVSLWSASTAGECRWRGPLTTPRAVAVGEKFRIVAGALVCSID